MAALFPSRRTIEVPCTIEIEHTHESLHAHVELQGVDIGPGDEVIVRDPPPKVPFGEKRVFASRAMVTRASWFERLLTPVFGYRELTELYEVGFSAGRAP